MSPSRFSRWVKVFINISVFSLPRVEINLCHQATQQYFFTLMFSICFTSCRPTSSPQPNRDTSNIQRTSSHPVFDSSVASNTAYRTELDRWCINRLRPEPLAVVYKPTANSFICRDQSYITGGSTLVSSYRKMFCFFLAGLNSDWWRICTMCKNIPSLIALSIHALTAVRLQPPRVKTQIAPNTAIIPEEDGTKKKKTF